MKKLILLSMFIMPAAFAQTLTYGTYVKMQEQLAADDFSGASASHKTICENELKTHKGQYKDCDKKFKNIDELRASFKNLSEVFIKHGNKSEYKGLITASCPMANAKWIQKEGSLKNPYYGKSMLECGEKI